MGYILGLGGPYYHDASACLVGPDGAIVAFVEEERLTRRKHSKDYRSCANRPPGASPKPALPCVKSTKSPSAGIRDGLSWLNMSPTASSSRSF